MKQFELHPASESYCRKEGAVNCSRRLLAAILSLVATAVCAFLVLAVSSTTAYAVVGDTLSLIHIFRDVLLFPHMRPEAKTN